MGMETGTLACAPDALGMEVVAGAEDAEATPSVVDSGRNPGGSVMLQLKIEMPADLLAVTGASHG